MNPVLPPVPEVPLRVVPVPRRPAGRRVPLVELVSRGVRPDVGRRL